MAKWSFAVISAVLALLGTSSVAWGQSTGASRPASPLEADVLIPKVYLQIGGEMAIHPTVPDELRIYPNVRGASPAGVLTVGRGLSPSLGLEVEAMLERPWSTPARIESSRPVTFNGEVWDSSVGANLRWHPGRKYRVELVVGGGVARSRYAKRAQIVGDTLTCGRAVRLEDTEVVAHQAIVEGGLACPPPIGSRVAVVPALGYRWVNRPVLSDAGGHAVSRHALRIGVTLRLFDHDGGNGAE